MGTDSVAEIPQCVHYWVIVPANGPTSKGTCQKCQETKEFENYIAGAEWGARGAGARGDDPPTDLLIQDDEEDKSDQ